jgi:hypothetical protein
MPMAVVAIFAGSSAAAAGSAPGVSLAATTAPIAGTAASTSLYGDTSVTTSNGVAWTLEVSWEQAVSGVPPVLGIGLMRTIPAGGTELHIWSFQVTAATLKFNAKTGVGKLNIGAQAKPVAKVDLAFKETSSKAATCASGSETVYSGTLKGKVSLVTGLAGGGTVGGSAVSFTAGTPEIIVDSSCSPAPANECLGLSGFVSDTDATSTFGAGFWGTEEGVALDSVDIESETALSAPAKATRLDAAEQAAAAPTYDSTTKVLSVTTSTSGFITGSATLSGGTVNTTTSTCSFGGKTYTRTATSDTNADYTSPAGKAISAKTSLSGTLTVPDSTGTASYEVVTSKVT